MTESTARRIVDAIHSDIRRAKSKQRESRHFARTGFPLYARQAKSSRDIALRTAEQRRDTLRRAGAEA